MKTDSVPNNSPIPSQLQENFRFILVPKGSKAACEKGWAEGVNIYTAHDQKLIAHLARRGNYGVLAGETHILIDGDSPPLIERVRKFLPPTFTHFSPGHRGVGFYFGIDWNEHKPKTMPLLDRSRKQNGDETAGHLRAGNGYLIGPGSTHPNGQKYLVLDDLPIAKITQPQLFEALAPYIAESANTDVTLESRKTNSTFSIDFGQIIDLAKLVKVGSDYYGPHPFHGSTTGRNFHIDGGRGVWYCFRCMSGGGPLHLLAIREGLISCEESKPGVLRGELFLKTVQLARDKGFEIKRELNADTPPDQMAAILLGKYQIRTMLDTGEPYAYHEGAYRELGNNGLEGLIQKELTEKGLDKIGTLSFIRETVGQIKRQSFVQRKKFDENLFILNLKNGLLDLTREPYEFSPHTADYLSVVQLPVAYDPNAKCPKILQYLSEIMYPADLLEMQELLGYNLWRRMDVDVAVMLTNEGSNGKKLFIELIMAILGTENYSARTIQELSHNRFAKADLYGKMANLSPDLPNTALKETGTFKGLCSGDEMQAEKKGCNPFKFSPYAKPWFSANQLPAVFDPTISYYRRWKIFTFPYTFHEYDPTKPKPVFSKDSFDRVAKDREQLRADLTTGQEFSGYLNYWLEGLARLRRNRWHFSGSRGFEEIKEAYIRKSNPTHAFVIDCLVTDPEAEVPKAKVYATFCEYCRDLSLSTIDQRPFFTNLIKLIHFTDTRPERVIDGKKTRVRCTKGFMVKDKQFWGKQLDDDNENGNESSAPKEPDKNALDAYVQRLQAEDLEHYREIHWPTLEEYAETYAAVHEISKESALELFKGAVQAGVIGQGKDGLFYVLLSQDLLSKRLRVGADSHTGDGR